MKKRLFSILGILLAIFSFTNVFALSKSDMATLKLKSIKNGLSAIFAYNPFFVVFKLKYAIIDL